MFQKNIFKKSYWLKIIIFLIFLLIGFIPYSKYLNNYFLNNLVAYSIPKLMLMIANLKLPFLLTVVESFAPFLSSLWFLFFSLIFIIFFKNDLKKIKVNLKPYLILLIIFLYFLFDYVDFAVIDTHYLKIMPKEIDYFSLFFSPVFTGFNEELVFRFLLIDFLLFIFKENKVTLVLSILLSSIIFSAVHIFGFFSFSFWMGLLLALLYISTNNIYLPILLHIFNNLNANFSQFVYYPKCFANIPLIYGALALILKRLLMILLIIILLFALYKKYLKPSGDKSS